MSSLSARLWEVIADKSLDHNGSNFFLIRICYNTLFSIFRVIICQVVTYRRLKAKENFLLLALKVVALTYERWSLTRGSKYSDLTWKLLVFWKTGCRGEVVADESLSDSVQVVVTPAAPQK